MIVDKGVYVTLQQLRADLMMKRMTGMQEAEPTPQVERIIPVELTDEELEDTLNQQLKRMREELSSISDMMHSVTARAVMVMHLQSFEQVFEGMLARIVYLNEKLTQEG